ncbi:hydroxyisourate hydrolase [Pseudomonas aeruginosa]|jgi:5-hydroxyisourate hydrolase
MSKSPITTHILDLGSGKPAAGVRIVLEQQQGDSWVTLAEAATDADGRVLNGFGSAAPAGVYRLTFDTDGYYAAQGLRCFYPEVTIAFRLDDVQAHYHVPLLLNQWGYSTYRGS